MIVNNISKISSLLKFKEGIFYYVQVIQRRKDHPDQPVSDIKRYQTFVTSQKDFEYHLPRIKTVCDIYEARAYISLIPRSLEKLTKQCALEYVKRINIGKYDRAWDIPNRLALSDDIRAKGVFPKPRWIFDVDDLSGYQEIIDKLEEVKIPIVSELETVSGKHIIVEAFNPKLLQEYKFKEDYKFPGGAVATFRPDCNTVLYANIPEILITE